MTKKQVVEGYLAAEKPYEVCAHTRMGGQMEFMRLERAIMFEENAKEIANSYAKSWCKSENIKGVCVRKGYTVIYEVEI